MSQGSLRTLQKNAFNSVVGFAKFAAATPAAFNTWKKIKDRQWEAAPQPVKDQAEVWEDCNWKRHLCQHKNLWVDPELNTKVTQKELAEFHHYKQDMWRMAHWAALFPILGGYCAIPWTFWFGNNTWVPSTFNANAEQKLQWRKDIDLYRYKHIPAYLAIERWYYNYIFMISDEGGYKLDQLFEKNDVRKQPEFVTQIAKAVDVQYPFWRCRRKQLRAMARAMGMPTFPMFGKICVQARIKDYWEIAWNEDYMVLKDHSYKNFTDEELQDYAWRRYLAPYDKNLNREQLLTRLEDYFAALGPDFLAKGTTPNIFIWNDYCMSYYNDPSYLENDFAELEGNDFEHLQSWGKDAFLKRLEFENGPFRDQVEAHSIKVLQERQKKLQELSQ